MSLSEKLKTVFIRARSMVLLFVFLLSILLVVTMPFELYRAISSQKWEPRKLLIKSSELVYNRGTRERGGSHSLKIVALDTNTNNTITISNATYGDFSFTFSAFHNAIFSSSNRYIEKYPAGITVVGYKDPKSNRYVLEKGKTTFPITAICISAGWLLVNILIAKKGGRHDSRENNIASL
jgi:hypothetical protein